MSHSTMSHYGNIAARYGIDPTDEDAVDEFFETTVQGFSGAVQLSILKELTDGIIDDMRSIAQSEPNAT